MTTVWPPLQSLLYSILTVTQLSLPTSRPGLPFSVSVKIHYSHPPETRRRHLLLQLLEVMMVLVLEDLKLKEKDVASKSLIDFSFINAAIMRTQTEPKKYHGTYVRTSTYLRRH